MQSSTIHDIINHQKPTQDPAQEVDDSTIDPDSEVEWITANYDRDRDDGGIQFPEPMDVSNISQIWPSIFMNNNNPIDRIHASPALEHLEKK